VPNRQRQTVALIDHFDELGRLAIHDLAELKVDRPAVMGILTS
jgi:hypothetical protein